MPTTPCAITFDYIAGINASNALRLAQLSLYFQRMFSKCSQLPMDDFGRFQLVGLQENAITVIESLMLTHIAGSKESLKQRHQENAWDLVKRWREFHAFLLAKKAQQEAVMEFQWVGPMMRKDIGWWVGAATAQSTTQPKYTHALRN